MGKAGAQIEISAGTSRLAQGLTAAKGMFLSWGGAVARGIGAAFKKANKALQPGETMKNAIGHVGGDIMGRGIDAFAGAAKDVRDFESNLQRLGVTTHQSPAQMRELANSIDKVSAATAVSRDELGNAASVYFDLTSDAKGMQTAMATFATTAQASGAGMEELVRTAAAAGGSMGIASTEFESMFSGLIAQGEAGQVTLKELAGEAPSLMAMFAKFGKGRVGVMEMNAAFQVGAKAFGSASQAATGLEAMMGMLQARQKQLAAAGVNVYQKNKDGTVTLRNLSKIVDDIRNKKIDPRKFGKIFGENKEGRAFMEKLIEMPDLYRDIVKAGDEAGTVQAYALTRAQSDAGRLDLALNNVKLTIAEAFTPERITAFTNAVQSLAEKLGPVIEFIGTAADKLGGLVNVGKSIRGALGGNGGRSSMDKMMDEGIISNASVVDPLTGKKWATDQEVAGAKSRLEDDKSRKAAQDAILGAEKNDRTTPESIRAAVLQANGGGLDYGKGKIGAMTAGEQYLRAAGVTDEERKKIEAETFLEAIAKIPDAIRAGMEASTAHLEQPAWQIGDNQVARAVDSSTNARRGTK